MINTSSDRIGYGNLLECPAGHKLDYAVCMTYSLDLDALTSALVSLGLSVATDSAITDNPVQLFAAMDSVKDKVAVFCEKGRVRYGSEYRRLFSLLEDSIVEVDLPKLGSSFYPSFHPKLWILRFVSDDGRVWYRVCVLSRNLTFDSSWDMAGCFESGYLSNTKVNRTVKYRRVFLERPLKRLIEVCSGAIDDSKRDKLLKIAGEIEYATFRPGISGWEVSDGLLRLSGDWTANSRSVDSELGWYFARAKRGLVMTPFLSSDMLRNAPFSTLMNVDDELPHCKEGLMLVTRREALRGQGDLGSLPSNVSIYAVRDEVASAPLADDENTDIDSTQRDIHAKIFLFETEVGDKVETCLMYGSANATYRGMTVNYEAMARLFTQEADAFDGIVCDLGLDEKSLGDGSIFESLDESTLEAVVYEESCEPLDDFDTELNHFVRRMKAEMDVCEHNNVYDVTIAIDGRAAGEEDLTAQVRVSLPTCNTATDASLGVAKFAGVELPQLTEFVRIAVTVGDVSRSRLVKCRLTNAAKEAMACRRAALFKECCASNTQDLVDYLEFCLGDNPEEAAIEISRRVSGRGCGYSANAIGLYERLVRAYAGNSEEAEAVVGECVEMLQDSGFQSFDAAAEMLGLLNAFEEGAKHASV